jgi:hypothetical protein
VFAIAYATEFCFNQYTGGKGLIFNTSVMRDHLLQCLSNKQLQPFPKVQPKTTLKLHKNTSVYINIVKDCNAKCDLPNIYDNMKQNSVAYAIANTPQAMLFVCC